VTLRPANPAELSALSTLAPELAATFATLASDIALVVDADGVIRNVALGGAEPVAPGAGDWVGRHWVDTVTGDTRRKIEQLLKEVADTGISRRREVNHPGRAGADIPIAYAAIRLGARGPVLAVGRDLRAIAAIQQRFVETQGEMERDYWKRRQSESRYRLLFEVATDAVFVVDAETLKIVDANAATCQLFDLAPENLLGRAASSGIDRSSRGAVDELLATARASGRPAEIRARLIGRRGTTRISATPFRSGDTMLMLVRASALDTEAVASDADSTLTRLVERTPYGVVVTDSSGRVQLANPAFARMVHAGHEGAVRGRSLADWLGGDADGADLAAMLAAVQRHGIVQHVFTLLRLPGGQSARVEASAVLLTEGEQENIGFTLRGLASDTRAPTDGGDGHDLVRSLQRLVALLGQQPLATLESEAAALVERHFVAAALGRAGGDVAAAAQLLGVGRAEIERTIQRHRLQPNGSGDAGASGSAA
jgi:transcriptional regulator PpsR